MSGAGRDGAPSPRRLVIVPYDPAWPAEFAWVGRALRKALGERALRIDHIGSTAVSGLAAKDVVDVQVTVAALDPVAIGAALEAVGCAPRPDITGDHRPPGAAADPAEWRKLYYTPPPGWRPTHLHVREAGRANQRYALLFRDYLRSAPAAAEAYRQVKEALARLHPTDADAYYDVKDPVCDLIADAAERWAAATGWQPGPSDA